MLFSSSVLLLQAVLCASFCVLKTPHDRCNIAGISDRAEAENGPAGNAVVEGGCCFVINVEPVGYVPEITDPELGGSFGGV